MLRWCPANLHWFRKTTFTSIHLQLLQRQRLVPSQGTRIKRNTREPNSHRATGQNIYTTATQCARRIILVLLGPTNKQQQLLTYCMPLATLWWGKVSTSLQHCLQQLLQLFIWDWRGAQMVLPGQAERKTACTFPAGDIPPGKATPAEKLVFWHQYAIATSLQHTILRPQYLNSTFIHMHAQTQPHCIHCPLPLQSGSIWLYSLMLALTYLDGAQSDKATAAAVQACLGC